VRIVLHWRSLEQHRELVATHAGNYIGIPKCVLKAPGHLAEQLIAQRAPPQIVDRFEVVEVYEHHFHCAPTPPATPNGSIEMLGEEGPVGKAGQRIMERLVSQLVFDYPLIGHISAVEHHSADAWLVDQVRQHRLEPAQVAVQVEEAPLRGHLARGVSQEAPQDRIPKFVVVGVEHGQKALAD
jgi:hypothetical protein